MHVLTLGKVLRLEDVGNPEKNGGTVVVGRDRALQTLYNPTCPTASAVQVGAYLRSTLRDTILARVELNCAKWSVSGQAFRYADKTGTIRSIRYGSRGLKIEIHGVGFTPMDGPAVFVEAQLQIGDQALNTRFHTFKQNGARRAVSRRPSVPAALGEAGFWDVMLGDDGSEANQQAVIGNLEKAVRRDRYDGRSQFLLAMMHMYRFGQRVTRFDSVSTEAHAELAAANTAFAAALPLLWDDASASGDSRVPGFAAAAKYIQGVVENDTARRDQGLADLERAVGANSFFNVFDLIPVLQALPPSDPVFQQAFALVATYLSNPETRQCVVTQQELCANAGFAPRNLQGSLTLFGDLYAKAGNLQQAQSWYNLASALPETSTWPFASLIQDRTANAVARVALYADTDPSNDPPLIGAGREACAMCHNR